MDFRERNRIGGHRREPSLTTPVDAMYADRSASPRFDAQDHRIADEGFAHPTVYLNQEEQAQRTARFRRGKILGASGPVDTRGASALADGTEDRQIFTMLPSGKFVMADAMAEVDRLKTGPERDQRFHHSSLARGEKVAAAGEMVIDNGELQKVTDRSGHYRPGPELTRQAIAELAEGGIPIERTELELSAKGNDRAVRGGALEILGYEAGDKDIQKKMLAARGRKGNVLADVNRLGREAGDHGIKPSSIGKKPAAASPPPLDPAAAARGYHAGLPPIDRSAPAPQKDTTGYFTGLPPIAPTSTSPASPQLTSSTHYHPGLPPVFGLGNSQGPGVAAAGAGLSAGASQQASRKRKGRLDRATDRMVRLFGGQF
jgi:hypothetical protein